MLCSTLNQGSVCTLQAQPLPEGASGRTKQHSTNVTHTPLPYPVCLHKTSASLRNRSAHPATHLGVLSHGRWLGTSATSRCGSSAVRRLCLMLLRAAVNTRCYCKADAVPRGAVGHAGLYKSVHHTHSVHHHTRTHVNTEQGVCHVEPNTKAPVTLCTTLHHHVY